MNKKGPPKNDGFGGTYHGKKEVAILAGYFVTIVLFSINLLELLS